MLGAMTLSIIFLIIDICSVTDAFQSILPVGINPFWKLSFVFKLLTDSVILDDFKTALDKLCDYNLNRAEGGSSRNWAVSRNVNTQRSKDVQDNEMTRSRIANGNAVTVRATKGRDPSTESENPCINVTTEMKIESFRLSEMGDTRGRSEPGGSSRGRSMRRQSIV